MGSSNGKEVGVITEAKGKVQIIKKNSFKGIDYKFFKGIVEIKDIVRTKRRSYAKINFIDKSKVFLDENSRLLVEDYIPSRTRLYVSTGKVIYKIYKRVKGIYEVKTPTALIGVKGTEFLVTVRFGITMIMVKDGTVEVFNPEFPHIKVKLTKGMGTVIKPNKPPRKPIRIPNIERFFVEKTYEKKETIQESKEKILLEETTKKDVGTEITEKNSEMTTIENQNETISTINQEISKAIQETTQLETANILLTGSPDNLQMDLYIPSTKFPE